MLYPCPAKTSPGAPPRHHRQQRARRGEARGERETTPPARPRAPKRTSRSAPGAPPRAKAKQRPHAQRRRRVRRDGGTPRPAPRGGALARGQAREASGECPLRQERPRGVTPRSGRVPHPFPRPAPHTAARRGGGARGEGPAGRARRAVPFAKECPSLVWRGLGPAQESATSPHRSSGKSGAGGTANEAGPHYRGGERNEARTAARNTGLPARKASSPPPLGGGGGKHGPRGRGPETHNSRCSAGPEAYGPLRSCGAGTGRGGKSGFGAAGQEAPGETNRPPAVQPPEDSVSTLISWYKMPTSGITWTVPRDGGIRLQITPASRKRFTATGDPTGPHRHQRRTLGVGGRREKGTGLSGRPPKHVVKSVPRTGGSKWSGPGRPRPPSPSRPRGQTCFRIGTLKKFRGAPLTTVSPEGPGHGAGAGPSSPARLPSQNPHRDCGKTIKNPCPTGGTHACARIDPPRPPPSSTRRPLPATTYGTPRLG